MYKFFVYYILLLSCCFYLSTGVSQAKNHNNASQVSNIRALHLVTRGSSVQEIKHLIDLAKSASFNTIILGITKNNSTALNSMPWIKSPKAWSRKELLSVVNYARSKDMEVIPHIPLLSHQKVFLKKPFPELMYNNRTYDPRNPKVYDVVFPILDEIIDLLHPPAIHIGHDEVVGWKKKHYEKGLLKSGEEILPAKLFLDDTLKIHEYLKSKGVDTWMWGDMLVSPDEFPTMRKGGLHGSAMGYGADLRKHIPKDIVICDWHYFDKQLNFPSLKTFRNEGFRVLGATWKRDKTTRNFSHYAAANGASGMMATTWYYVPKKEWDLVEHIINFSGRIFVQDFPDVKK